MFYQFEKKNNQRYNSTDFILQLNMLLAFAAYSAIREDLDPVQLFWQK